MKRLANFSFLFVLLVLVSCGRNQSTGELTGVLDRPKWKVSIPYGMSYIKAGTFHIGSADEDISRYYIHRPKAISIMGFYMDDTEISNNEYRQFVHHVRDSVAHAMMGDFIEDEYGNERIDYELELDWASEDLDDMYYQGDDKIGNARELNVNKLVYDYSVLDIRRAAENTDPTVKRSEYIEDYSVNIYPDTLVWIRDFTYSYNDPMTKNYFSHPAYDDYPVVGVTWEQANAFCHWRTEQWNRFNDNTFNEEYRLPTEFEWEYAARGGHEFATYPWGDPYIRNAKGCLLANFKPGRGNYPEDGGQYTVKVDAYYPNDYGLFNMSGNVAEWTLSAFVENAYSYIHDLNPDVQYDASEDELDAYKRKVIRGGSWKDIAYFLRVSTRHWEYQDKPTSYIGFRCILPFSGRSINDFR